jgi:hypothetical protein
MRPLLAVLLLLCAAPALLVAQTPEDQARRARMEARRDSLEREVVQKFVDRLTRELKLDADQRAQTERVLTSSGVQRRELMRASGALRGRIVRATRNDATSDADFARMLTEHETLRAREHDLWRREQEELARFLTPRQRVQFIVQWAHFQDEMRDILSRRMREQGQTRPGGGVPHLHSPQI